ncbi:MAG: TonB-linked SusC/RagA family outer membrane protein [Gammaproteobacteria bacterium]|jgi:TonB-linked SusC/RagA family outer membrane protein
MRLLYKSFVWKHVKEILLFCFLFNSILIFSQQESVVVKGNVFDNDNTPIPGVSIYIEGTTTGTTSGFDGDFRIEVPVNDTLVISYLGFKTKKIVVTKDIELPLNINLEPNVDALDEVVIVSVGYGTMRKSDLTGAISSISSKDLRKGVITSTEQVLQGKVAGLSVVQGSGDPASGATLRLRGGTSLTASNSPLVVVDGIAGVDINTVQPSEILSIDVLKDASSAAIYGSRGSNGVIIITTSREGRAKSMSYSSFFAVGKVNRRLDMLSANQWREYVRNNNVQGATDFGGNTNWPKALEQTSFSQSHTLAFSSGDKKSGVRSSVTFLQNEGVIKTTTLQRLSGSLSAYQYGLNDKLKFQIGLNASNDDWQPLDYRIFQRAYNLSPVIPIYDNNGDFTSVGGTNYENPLEILTNRTAKDKRHRLLGYFKGELDVVSGLKAVVNLSYELNSHKGNLYKPTFAVLEGNTDKGFGQKTLGEYENRQLETYLTYDKEIGNHRFNILGGYSYLENVYEGFGSLRRGFSTDLFEYNNLGAGFDYQSGDVYSYKGESKLISFYSRANYTFSNKYMFTGTVRWDGSSRFGANNKWGVFPSASFAWKISEEDFMESTSNWLNKLKLRIGYGVTGNQDGIGEYKSLSIMGAGSASYYDAVNDIWQTAFAPTQNPNPDLKWESTEQLNIGIDFSLFNRINATIEVYQKNTSDLLYTYSVPQPPFLVGTMLANVGDLSNRGIELTLNTNIITTDDLQISSDLVLASNKQKIEKLSNDQFETDEVFSGSLFGLPGMSNQFSQIIKEGFPVGTFWGYEALGKDANGNFILSQEKTDLGNIQPKLTLGFGMNFKYKSFDVSFLTSGMFGQKVLNATGMSLWDRNRLPAQNVPDAFLESGINSDAKFSSYWVEDASFFRLQTLSVGYTFNFEEIGISNARLYATGENIFVITGYTGADPEVSIGGLDSPGIDRFNFYPRPTTVSLGINLSF